MTESLNCRSSNMDTASYRILDRCPVRRTRENLWGFRWNVLEKKFNILIGNFTIFVKFKLTLKMLNYAKVIIFINLLSVVSPNFTRLWYEKHQMSQTVKIRCTVVTLDKNVSHQKDILVLLQDVSRGKRIRFT